MARRGAKPDPTALKKLKGDPGKRGYNEKEATPSRDISLEPPAWMELNDDAKKAWFRLAPMVHRNGLLTEADVVPFARYCDMLPKWIGFKRVLDEEGPTYEVKVPVYEGYGNERVVVDYTVAKVVARPEVKLYESFNKSLQNLECEFGLTPSARSRIIMDEGAEQDDLDFYFRSQRKA